MARNVFDQASRFAVRLDPDGFLEWALNRKPGELRFREWLDTRGVPFPGGEDRTGDTVARVDNAAGGGEPWAVAVEFQIVPDADMFGRLLVYAGGIFLALRPDAERGSRYRVGTVVVNLTGKGNAARRFVWPATGMELTLRPVERNLEHESAAALLGAIGTGDRSRGLLPWVPLMSGGGDSDTIERWKELALAEPDTRRRSEYGGLAKVFAGAAGRFDIWSRALEGWNMLQSQAVLEWQAEARKEGMEMGRREGRIIGRQEGVRFGQLELLEAQLTTKFGPLSEAALETLRDLPDDRLREISVRFVTANSLADLGLCFTP